MTAIIVSYDGTPNDEDALALGQLLAGAGGSLALAYVRHSREYDPGREELAQHDADRRLEHGATWLGDPDVPRHVVISASTGQGLAELAQAQGASVIVFGSDYRIAPGRVEPGTSAQTLLDGGSVATALAPAGLRTRAGVKIESVAVGDGSDDPAAEETARGLAAALGVELVSPTSEGVGLVVLGSQDSAASGQVRLSSAGRSVLESVRAPVLVVPRGTPVVFDRA